MAPELEKGILGHERKQAACYPICCTLDEGE